MAHVYVDSAAAGAGTGADWTNAFTTLQAACAAMAAGDSIWVAHTHAQTQASLANIYFPHTPASPGTVMCVNKAGSVPPVAADLRTTATVTTTGNNGIQLQGAGVYVYGITFSAGTGAVDSLILFYNPVWFYFKNCVLQLPGTSSGRVSVGVGSTAPKVVLDNTSLVCGSVGDFIEMAVGEVLWKNTNTPLGGGLVPTILFNGDSGVVTLQGLDLSVLGAGKTLFGTFLGTKLALIKNCKIHASVTISTTPTMPGRSGVITVNCDSGDTNYRTEKYSYEGTQTTETTVVLSGGAGDGTTPISWKIVTNGNSEILAPFESLPISIWNDTTGARTVTVQGTWTAGALPNNNQIWMEVEYLGNSGSTQSSFASTGPDTPIAAPVALAAGDGTWGGSTTKFKMTSSITVAEKGPITVKVYAAEPLATIYIDPKVALT